MQTRHRPAVRIICLDARSHVLLLHWRDPLDGSTLWEPPGGGIEPGEAPLQAARRELTEETGLDPSAIVDSFIVVHRDNVWNGVRFAGPEQFFVAHYPSLVGPVLRPAALNEGEQSTLLGYDWVSRSTLQTLDGVVPATLDAEIARLHPTWAS